MKKKLKLLLTLCAAATLSLGAIAFSACGDKEPAAHDHVWGEPETKTAATCTKDGERIRHCLVEGCTEIKPETINKRGHSWGELENTATCTEPGVMRQHCKRENCEEYKDTDQITQPLGHDFQLEETITPASCTVEGQGKFACSRCTATETRTLDKLPHSFGSDAETEPATCEEDGVIHGKCSTCDKVVDEVIPAWGHNWQFNRITKAATCEDDGEESYFCLRKGCGKSETRVIPALGHSYDDSEIIYPTFDADGSESGHCAVCNRNVTTILPKLEEGQEIEFIFRISRNNGDLIGSDYMKITVTDKNENVVASGTETVINNTRYPGLLVVTLPVHRGDEFTMTVGSLYAGYTANQTSVKVVPEHPVGNYYITAHMIDANDRSPSSYIAGSIMQDFELRLIDGKTVTLRELLAKNKVVMLNIFGVDCFWCKAEFPGLHKAYLNYKAKGIEVVALAPYSVDYKTTSEQDVINYMQAEGFTFPAAYLDINDPLFSLYSKFGLSGYPASIFIDHEGVVNYIHPGAMILEPDDKTGRTSQQGFEMLFEICANWKWLDDIPTTASVNDGLELSMIRGDYLPCDEQ